MTMTLQNVADQIRYVDDFPKPGIRFFDIESIVEDGVASTVVMYALYERYKDAEIDYIVGFDARGFLFGFALAQMLGVGFKQARKPGKLPGETVSFKYETEYSSATIEMEQTDLLQGKRILLIDDLLATGGTAEAGVKLVEELGGNVVECAFVIELPDLAGRQNLMDTPVYSLISIVDGKAIKTREFDGDAGVRYCIDPIVVDENTGDILLVERLSTPLGIAMAGGGIEMFESVADAIVREVAEELNCTVLRENIEFKCVLTGADRDPRGVQVAYVCIVHCDTSNARGEHGKTNVVRIPYGSDRIPGEDAFAFSDHHKVMSDFMKHKKAA